MERPSLADASPGSGDVTHQLAGAVGALFRPAVALLIAAPSPPTHPNP